MLETAYDLSHEELDRLWRLEREEAIERARAGILGFVLYTMPSYEVWWHHVVMARAINRFVNRECKRLIITTPPRHGKSQLVSRHLPAYALGCNPNTEVVAVSYGGSLATSMSRDCQRILTDPTYRDVFPGTAIPGKGNQDVGYTRTSERFDVLGYRGKYQSCGMGGSLTGRGADLGIIDDYLRNAQDARSQVIREGQWDWYTAVFYTRISKGGGILITACMTGDTRVLMADGSQVPLRFIKPGDKIATYENGQITSSTVRDWRCEGLDKVYRVKTSSGITVTANGRHPFLVLRDGELQWVRLRELRLNDKLMRVTERTREWLASKTAATSQPDASSDASLITTRNAGLMASGHHPTTSPAGGPGSLNIATASPSLITRPNWPSKTANVRYAATLPGQASTCPQAGTENSALTIATFEQEFAACCAMSAISSSSTPTPSKFCSTPWIICDPIVKIHEAGVQEVFDVQVDRTENFIANGVVSHNTRWHEDDLVGRLLRRAESDPSADQWEVINLPAIAEGDLHPEDPRKLGEALWPARYDMDFLQKTKAQSERVFVSLYQGRPSPQEGNIFKRAWWRFYRRAELPPKFDRVGIFCDLTFKDAEKNDYNVFLAGAALGAKRYVLDLRRLKAGFTRQVEVFKQMVSKHPEARRRCVEDAANGAALIDHLHKEITGIVAVPPRGSKLARAEAVSHFVEAGDVLLPHPDECPWTESFIQELNDFPNAPNDDQVDAFSMFLSQMEKNRLAGGFSVFSETKKSLWKE